MKKTMSYLTQLFKHDYPALGDKLEAAWLDPVGYLIVRLQGGEKIIFDPYKHMFWEAPVNLDNMSSEELMFEFKNRMRTMLKRHNMKQNELARLSGVSETTINNYCQGNTMPTLYSLYLICRVFGCSLDIFQYHDPE